MGKELQAFSVDSNYTLLGFGSYIDEMDSSRHSHAVLDDCLIASEIYESGFTLNNSVYRFPALCSMKLLHGMRLIDLNQIEVGKEYLNDCREYMKQAHLNNPGMMNQIELVESRLSCSELKYE